MDAIPTGTVTYLFTDIEGSTRLWEQYPDAMKISHEQHDTILRTSIESHHGSVYQIRGDAFCATFWTALDGILAALEAQRRLTAADWNETGPLQVRMVVHTGVSEYQQEGLHTGPFLNRVGRMLSAASGGQVLVGTSTQALVRELLPADVSLRDLGEYTLRDVKLPERIFQLVALDLPDEFPPLLTQSRTIPNNLPAQLSTFVGRKHELEQINHLLTQHHLITLIGPGGTGKTRLAVEVAAESLDNYPAGVFLLELAQLQEPDLLVQTLAMVLDLREQPGQTLLALIVNFLRDKRILLVVDNCEHIINACAYVIDTLLKHCRTITILATSREALGISGEVLFRVPSLTMPDMQQFDVSEQVNLHMLMSYTAIQLFVERATAVQPDFELTVQNAPIVVQICRRLDGIPLAIELAAARMNLLSVEQIAGRLDQCFRLLTSGSRTAMPRQQTLRATIDWSYDLLTESEKLVFQRLAVFIGGWTIEAAEGVATGQGIDSDEMLDILVQLVNKSLVVVERQGPETRYRYLETIRVYALEKLTASGARDRMHMRHLEWFLQFCHRADQLLRGQERVLWNNRLEFDLENIRSALNWARENTPDLGLRLASSLWWFWWLRGYISEGQMRLLDMLSVGNTAGTYDRAYALIGTGILTLILGNMEQAGTFLEESVSLARKADNSELLAEALVTLGWHASRQGDAERAEALCEESLALARAKNHTWQTGIVLFNLGALRLEHGAYTEAVSMLEESLALGRQTRDPWLIAAAVYNLGHVAYMHGEYTRAESFYTESLALGRTLHDSWGIAVSLTFLGFVALQQAEYSRSYDLFWESIAVQRKMGSMLGSATPLEGLAGLAIAQGQPEPAARLLGAAANLREKLHDQLASVETAHYARILAAVQAELAPERFSKLWKAGQALNFEQAVEYAQSEAAQIMPE